MGCRQRHEGHAGGESHIGSGRLGRLGLLAIVAMSAWALLATAAQAATITVGSVLPPGSTPTAFGQVQDAEGGPFRLRVLRPNGSGAYTAVGTSNPATPSGPGVQTFTANLPIHAGDVIGVDPTSASDKIGVAEVPGASYGFIFPPPFDAATVAPSGTVSGKEIELSAEIQPRPTVTAVTPSFGSIAGRTSVTIAGTDFNAASAVKFGSAPATGFTVESDTQITAIAPRSKKVGAVDVTVTTLAGTSATTRNDLFFYEGCVVPKLKGKKLKRGRKALRRADCRIGTVKRRKGESGEVLKQSPRPGRVLAPGARVNVTVGR